MSNKLTEKQLTAIEYLALPNRGGLQYAEIAEKVGVDERTLRRWRTENDDFYEVMKRTIVRNTADDLPKVMASMPEIILRDGNAAMARTFLQAHGLLTDKVDVNASQSTVGADVDAIKARLAKWSSEGEE